MVEQSNDLLDHCRRLVEHKFDRGEASTWTNYDFEKLSDSIHDRTSVKLSPTTLKRLWGRLKYESAPTLTTLNAVAQFAGFDDWRDFERKTDIETTRDTKETPVSAPSFRKKGAFWAVGLIVLAITVFVFIAARRNLTLPTLDPTQFSFSANKMITEGVPNSVVFNYDASRATTDSVFIVQTWDISRKTLVSRKNHEHSAIYYYPGFFRAKLIADNQIVKTHDLWITSDGWLGLLENQPMPIYLRKEEYMKPDRIEVDATLAKSRQQTGLPRVRLFNQRDLGDLMNDNFTFETELKNDFDDGTNACHFTQVLIQCKNDIIIIPLTSRSCIGNLSLYFCGKGIESKSADLSNFGVDLTKWTNLRIETVNRAVTIFVNNNKAYSLNFPNAPTGIVGVQYRFNGAGAVKYATFTSNGKKYPL